MKDGSLTLDGSKQSGPPASKLHQERLSAENLLKMFSLKPLVLTLNKPLSVLMRPETPFRSTTALQDSRMSTQLEPLKRKIDDFPLSQHQHSRRRRIGYAARAQTIESAVQPPTVGAQSQVVDAS
ncbi:hypothetical protein AB6A40_000137 [Gnathostoma spinigerum]|uniref:Uncharacterized protein n=1 Tax=Gnathostoma spinigerum TaxID=75299 RepID=A0ABD6E1K7_9BILA